MKRVSRIYGALIGGLATVAGLMLAAIVVTVVFDVGVRTIGLQPPAMTTALGEYSLLFATMFAAPWLVRSRGHIVVESLLLLVPTGIRRWVERLAYLLCAALCLLLASFAFGMAAESLARGDIDIRAIDMPRWLLFASISGGFGLMTLEFVRLLCGRGTLYAGGRGGMSDSL
ncbi:MAG: TRAP transporter small permease [Sphingomonadales bacterium]